MTDHPHVPAAFINALAEEGTKAEAIEWLQKTWNELCAVKAAAAPVANGDTYPTLRTANAARQKAWDSGGQIDAAYRGNELAGEVGEACNVIKKLERERMGIRGSRDSVEHLAEELADVIICVDLIAMHYGIDMDEVVARKFNATSEKVDLPHRLAVRS